MSPSMPRKLDASSSSLFGNDDSEFLEALRKVNIPNAETPQLPIPKEPSSSSDLFGTDDSTFLDVLSKTTLPGDLPVHDKSQSDATTPKKLTPKRTTQDVEFLKRKRSISPEETSPSIMYEINAPDCQIDASYTDDSAIYGASKFEGYGEYMYRKRAKLSIQNSELEDAIDGEKSTLFQGLAIYINGQTNPSVQELRKLIVQHGGIFHPYLDRKKMVTHIIASNLTPSKVLEFKLMKVVRPEWLIESIRAGTLLPWRQFIIGAGSRLDESQGRATSNQSITMETTERPNSPVADSSRTALAEVTPLTTTELFPKPSPDIRPLHVTDPATKEEASRTPSYATHSSNPYAKRKMENPQWRAENTAVAPGFLEGFYRNSRLHHLSSWKAELQELVAKATERVENDEEIAELADPTADASGGTSMGHIQFLKPLSPRKGKGAIPDKQTIMHCDFDAFFVSAGLVDRPHLRGKPVVVCHSQGEQGGVASTSEIASSSYEARKFGIKNGMSLGQAKKLCSELHTIPYEFEQYKRFSLIFYTILMSYADDLQAVSVDEALVDVSSAVENARRLAMSSQLDFTETPDFAKGLAETIRTKVRRATGCEVSIGISHNILLARVATRRAKPAGSYHIQPDEVSDILAPLDIEDLRGFGWSTRSKVKAKFGVTTLGELAKRPKGSLCDALGKKTGETLWKAVRGIDDTKIESDRVRKSVSCEINYGIRFENDGEAEGFVRGVAREVADRLVRVGMCGRSLTLKVMVRDPDAPLEPPKFLGHGICDVTNKTAPIAGPGDRATGDSDIIGDCAWRLLKGMHIDPKELRGIGIHVQKLEKVLDDINAPAKIGQSVLPFKRAGDDTKELPTRRGELSRPTVTVEPPSQENDKVEDRTLLSSDSHHLKPESAEQALPSFSQVDPSFLEALPLDIRDELEREYKRTNLGQAVAGPSRLADANSTTPKQPPSVINQEKQLPSNVARITRQLAPKSRLSLSPTKRMHPLFAKRSVPNALKVEPAELKLLDIDAEVWDALPFELQREQLAALRAANVGTGMAIRASMSTQAKQERILSRWRARRSPSVGIRGQRLEVYAKALELPGLKQRGKSKSEELRVSETDDIQAVLSQWVRGFEEDGPRRGDVEYFGNFLERCVETDVGAEKGVSALKWWKILLHQRWSDMERVPRADEEATDGATDETGRAWWNAFWEVKKRMDAVVRKKYGGKLSVK